MAIVATPRLEIATTGAEGTLLMVRETGRNDLEVAMTDVVKVVIDWRGNVRKAVYVGVTAVAQAMTIPRYFENAAARDGLSARAFK